MYRFFYINRTGGELIAGKGYCLETLVLVTNSDDYLELLEAAEGSVNPSGLLLNGLR